MGSSTDTPSSASPEFLAVFRAEAGSGGVMTFARFMELALYHPVVGYYPRDRVRVGQGGGTDFFTATTSGPVFGELVSAACADLLGDRDPRKYTFVEIGAEPGQSVLAEVAHPFATVETRHLGAPVALAGDCVVFSNELFDAQPCVRTVYRNGRWHEIGVALDVDELVEVELPLARIFHPLLSGAAAECSETCSAVVRPSASGLSAKPLPRQARDPEFLERAGGFAFSPHDIHAPGCQPSEHRRTPVKNLEEREECGLGAPGPGSEGYHFDQPRAAATLAADIAAQPWRGLFVAFDYGKTLRELAQNTPAGTVRACHRHVQSNALLARPGEQDLTCHVCWDWMSAALRENGFPRPVLEFQEFFFLHHAAACIAAISATEAGRLSRRKLALLQLLHPSHLGQKFQVLYALR